MQRRGNIIVQGINLFTSKIKWLIQVILQIDKLLLLTILGTMREVGKAHTRPIQSTNALQRKSCQNTGQNNLPDDHQSNTSKLMLQKLPKNTISLQNQSEGLAKLIKKSANIMQYEKINIMKTNASDMKKQISKYLFYRFQSWIQNLTEDQIREVYEEIVKDRRFQEAKEIKYQWINREKMQKQKIAEKCRKILAQKAILPPNQTILQKNVSKMKQNQIIQIDESQSEQLINPYSSLNKTKKITNEDNKIDSRFFQFENEHQQSKDNVPDSKYGFREDYKQELSPISLLSTVDMLRQTISFKENSKSSIQNTSRMNQSQVRTIWTRTEDNQKAKQNSQQQKRKPKEKEKKKTKQDNIIQAEEGRPVKRVHMQKVHEQENIKMMQPIIKIKRCEKNAYEANQIKIQNFTIVIDKVSPPKNMKIYKFV